VGAEAILPHATALARAYGVPVELLHVSAETGVEADDSKLRSWIGREKKRMDARFAEIEKGAPDLEFARVCVEGDAASRILSGPRVGPRRSSRWRTTAGRASAGGSSGPCARRSCRRPAARCSSRATPTERGQAFSSSSPPSKARTAARNSSGTRRGAHVVESMKE